MIKKISNKGAMLISLSIIVASVGMGFILTKTIKQADSNFDSIRDQVTNVEKRVASNAEIQIGTRQDIEVITGELKRLNDLLANAELGMHLISAKSAVSSNKSTADNGGPIAEKSKLPIEQKIEELIELMLVDAIDESNYTQLQDYLSDVTLLKKYIGDVEEAFNAGVATPEKQLFMASLYTDLAFKSGGREARKYGTMAERLRLSVIEEDPNNWQARYDLALVYSMYPAFLNKEPEAVKHFEYLTQLQQTTPYTEQHYKSYLQLSNIYKRAGNFQSALQVLQAGLKYYPNSEELQAEYQLMSVH